MQRTSPPGKRLGAVAALALAYLVLGALTLLFASPSDYITPVFPSAGIALAGVLIWGWRVWPGVFLGAFILNMGAGIVLFDLNLGTSASAAAFMSTGATLQALTARFLIYRYVQAPKSLATGRDILHFLVLGGLLSSLISATVSVSTLMQLDIITSSEFSFSWWNRWISDAIGVMIATPVILAFYGQPAELWRQRRLSVALPLIASCIILIAVFTHSVSLEKRNLEYDFREQAKAFTATLTQKIRSYLQALNALERFYAASENVSRSEFRVFVEDLLIHHSGMQALEWLPLVNLAERQVFESNIQQQGFPGFHITELNARNELVSAGVRDVYAPVTFVEPYYGNENALGYDPMSDATRNSALIKARDSGEATTTSPITLVQDQHNVRAMLVFKPFYEKGRRFDTIEARRNHIEGFILGVFRIDSLIQTQQPSMAAQHIRLHITDITQLETPHRIHGDLEVKSLKVKHRLNWAEKIDFAGRSLLIDFEPGAQYIKLHRSWQAWSVPAFGLLSISLMSAFLLSVSGHTEQIRQLVDRRTLELSAILQNTIDAIITIDERGRIESVNPAATRLFGYSAQEMLNRDINDFMPDSYSVERDHNLTQELMPKMVSAIGRTREALGLRKDGKSVPVELGLSRVQLPDRLLYTGIIHNLTERRKVDRMKSEFISAVSHELRTPLTSIRGSLGLIESGSLGKTPDKIMDLVRIANNNCNRLVFLINDILDIERLEIGQVNFNIRRFDITQLVESAIQYNTGFAKEYKVKLRIPKPPPQPLHVDVDADRLLQVLANLISNAVKFSPSGGVVTLAIDSGPYDVTVTITDQGPGIPEEFKTRIFNKFAQADTSNTRARGGTGLGLSIVKMILERMGGEIGFESNPGTDTRFYFTLPLSDNSVSPMDTTGLTGTD